MRKSLSSVHRQLIRQSYTRGNNGICLREGQTVADRAPHKKENVMRRIIGGFGVIAVAGLVLLAPVARAADEKVPLDKIPKAVMEAIKAKFPDAEVTNAEKETVDGKVVYDIELKQKNRKHEMDIQEDGTVLEIENEIAVKDLPEAVTKAVEVKYPKSTIKEVMEVKLVKDKKEKLDHYEVTLETGDKESLEVTVSLDGKTIKEED